MQSEKPHSGNGKSNPQPEAPEKVGAQAGIATEGDKVVIVFGEPTTWMKMTVKQAIRYRAALDSAIHKAQVNGIIAEGQGTIPEAGPVVQTG